MRIEKRLKQEVEYSNQKILQDGQTIRENLIREYCNQSCETTTARHIKSRPLWISASCIIVCCLIVSICCLTLMPDNPNKPNKVYYLTENEQLTDITLEEFNENVKIELNLNDITLSSIKKCTDKVSQDLLFYTVSFASEIIFPYGDVFFSDNENYNSKFRETFGLKDRCVWKNYELFYEISKSTKDGLSSLVIRGEIQIDDVVLWFTYNDIDLGEPITPIDILDSLIIL